MAYALRGSQAANVGEKARSGESFAAVFCFLEGFGPPCEELLYMGAGSDPRRRQPFFLPWFTVAILGKAPFSGTIKSVVSNSAGQCICIVRGIAFRT